MISEMVPVTSGGVTWYRFPEKPLADTCHGFFTRKGGVSPEPWKSLNLSESVGDSRANVIQNRRFIFDALHRPVESIYDVWQVHSTDVICVETPRDLTAPHLKADGILTDNPNITLLMRFADCVPILLYDPIRRVVGLVHAGWQGTVANIAGAAIAKMIDQYHSEPVDIVAGIGPSIGLDHYQVGVEVYNKAEVYLAKVRNLVFHQTEDSCFFDLWGANSYLLRAAGVKHIFQSGLCTACDIDNWFSHRYENNNTGRFAAVIALDGPGNGNDR